MNDLAMPFASPAAAGSDGTSAASPGRGRNVSVGQRFRAMVDAHFDFIWRSLRGLGVPAHSVDDAAQHVFWVAAQKLEQVAVGSERSFLYGTAVGVAANARRSRGRNREILDAEAVDARADDAPTGERFVEMKERRALLDEILSEMPDDLREVFVLYVLEGMVVPEIADMLDIAHGTAASRLRRARETFHTLSKRHQARAGNGRRQVP